ncbi:hypothetical protein B296_00032406 [Ensete ventricosum]|uniref:Uncharacterized protein n=1 Tax=Ensete ventricosum TaxID=4639 RepID=A0A427A784_ENSVE|nr:hypothetical protein B296_00032406 [Ensete ventricosum]
MADLTKVRLIPSPVDASLTARTTSVVEAYDDRVSHKDNRVASRLPEPGSESPLIRPSSNSVPRRLRAS